MKIEDINNEIFRLGNINYIKGDYILQIDNTANNYQFVKYNLL